MPADASPVGEAAEITPRLSVGESHGDLADVSLAIRRIERQADLETESGSKLQRSQQRAPHGALPRQRLRHVESGFRTQDACGKSLDEPESATSIRSVEYRNRHVGVAQRHRPQQVTGQRSGIAQIGIDEQVDVGGTGRRYARRDRRSLAAVASELDDACSCCGGNRRCTVPGAVIDHDDIKHIRHRSQRRDRGAHRVRPIDRRHNRHGMGHDGPKPWSGSAPEK